MSFRNQASIASHSNTLVFLGDAGSGKTSLLRCLAGDGFDEKQEPTRGLNVRHIVLTDSHNQSASFNAWDFPGQGIFHWINMLFSPRTPLFIITASARNGDCSNSVGRWISAVSFWAREPFFLLAFTYGEWGGAPSIDKYLLQGFPSI